MPNYFFIGTEGARDEGLRRGDGDDSRIQGRPGDKPHVNGPRGAHLRRPVPLPIPLIACLSLMLNLLSACTLQSSAPAWTDAPYAPAQGTRLDVQALTALGRRMFFDPALSASGNTSCASCHDPQFGYGPPNALPVQLAGRDGATPGPRAAPSLRYLQTHFAETR